MWILRVFSPTSRLTQYGISDGWPSTRLIRGVFQPLDERRASFRASEMSPFGFFLLFPPYLNGLAERALGCGVDVVWAGLSRERTVLAEVVEDNILCFSDDIGEAVLRGHTRSFSRS